MSHEATTETATSVGPQLFIVSVGEPRLSPEIDYKPFLKIFLLPFFLYYWSWISVLLDQDDYLVYSNLRLRRSLGRPFTDGTM